MGAPQIIGTFPHEADRFSTLDKMIAFGEFMASATMDEHKEVPPIWYLVNDTEAVAVLTPWQGENDKKISIALLRAMIDKFRFDRYVFFTEIWLANVAPDTPEDLAKMMPMNRPDRREAVMIHAFERDNPDSRCEVFDIVRVDQNNPKLVKSDMFKNAGHLEGRMFNLFADQPKPN